jgi:hypothetical protein
MDIGDLLLLLFLLFPLLNRALKKKRQVPTKVPSRSDRMPQATAPVPLDERESSSDSAADDAFARAIREIQEALTATGAEQTEDLAHDVNDPEWPETTVSSEPEFTETAPIARTEFQPLRDASWKEDAFESEAWSPPDLDIQTSKTLDETPTERRHPLAVRLRDRKTARDAILVSEILQPPLSLRRTRR